MGDFCGLLRNPDLYVKLLLNFECNVILHTYHENFAGLKKVNDGRDTKFGYAYYLLIMPFKTRLIICTKEV